MFKYVELMRKSAFRIMSKTYGGKSKDANETIHDAYPLKSLARLLCFETLDEAREACRHYNITVKPTKIRSSSGISVEEIIFWRQSSFTEPKDEDKGTHIPLPPQKMLRTIEGKLQGATRLAVCRGQVSGPGAFLTSQEREVESAIHGNPVSNARSFAGVNDHFQGQSTQGATLENQADAKFEAIRKLQLDLLRQQTNKEAERTQEEARRIEEEEIRRKAAEEDARRKLEEESRKHEMELRRKQAEEERRRREENQKRILEAQQLEQERIERERELRVRRAREEESRLEQLRIEAEMKRKRAEEENEERKKKADEAARQRQLDIDRQNRIRLQYEADQRRREEEEKERLRLAEEQRKREEEESRRREALRQELEAQRIKEEEERAWAAETEEARKSLMWGIWKDMYPVQPSIKHTAVKPPHQTSSDLASCFRRQVLESAERAQQPLSLGQVVRNLLRSDASTSLAMRVAENVPRPPGGIGQSYPPLLLNVVVFVPMPYGNISEICELASSWISLRLGIGGISSAIMNGRAIRVAVVDYSGSADTDVVADVALVVLTPPWSDAPVKSKGANDCLDFATARLDKGVPTVILSLREHPSPSDFGFAGKLASFYDESLVLSHESVDEENLDEALTAATQALVDALSEVVAKDDTVLLDRFSLVKLGFMALRSTLWRDPDLASYGRNSIYIEHAKRSLACFVDVLDEYSHDLVTSDEMMSPWPSRVFATSNGLVEDYFGEGIHLPLNWKTLLRAEDVKPRLGDLCSLLNGTLVEVVHALLAGGPFVELQESDDLFEQKRYQECLHHALLCGENVMQYEEPFAYLPRSMVKKLLNATAERFEDILMREEGQDGARTEVLEVPSIENDFIGPIDLPPTDEEEDDEARPSSSVVDSHESVTDGSADAKTFTNHDTEAIEGAIADKPSEKLSSPADVEEQDDPDLFPPVSSSAKRQHSQEKPTAQGARSGAGSRGRGHGVSPARKRPRSVRESRAFTRRLRELAQGDTVDMMVGSVPMSILLADVPDLVDDVAARASRSNKE
jgi:hypothetical protein